MDHASEYSRKLVSAEEASPRQRQTLDTRRCRMALEQRTFVLTLAQLRKD